MKKYIHNYYAIFRLGLQHKNRIFYNYNFIFEQNVD